MKRVLSVFRYFILSAVLFLGGVTVEDSQTENETGNTQNLQRNMEGLEDPDIFLYYYSLLDDTEKEYYDQISDAISAERESVTLEGISYKEAEKILISVMNDHPEYFWLDSSYTYKEEVDEITFIFDYNSVNEAKKERGHIIEERVFEIINGIPEKSSDYEKVKYVFETLVDQTEYDRTAADSQNIYSVFGNRRSVCAGYAKATKYLLDCMGVEAIYVTGTAGESHAWNIVNCDGLYYCVDTTWGDPTYLEGRGVNIDTTAYEYLCCTSEMLSRTHMPDPLFPLPECMDPSLEYYRMAGRYLESADQEQILDIMEADIDRDADRTDIQFRDPDVFNQVISELDSLLGQAIEYEVSTKGSGAGSVRYQYNESTCLLTVIWEN